MIEEFSQIKRDFDFNQDDVENIRKLKPIFERYVDDFIDKFYEFILRFPQAKRFLKDEETIKRHREKVKKWFLELFNGNYDLEYFLKLKKIGEIHVKIGLPTHYVNASMNFVRRYIIDIIDKEIESRQERNRYVASIGKLLDINLDILTVSYREEELSKYAEMTKMEKMVFSFAKKFSDVIDLFILTALVIVALSVFFLFGYDLYKLVFNIVELEEGILAVLGSLLILWAVGELMSEELRHLKGGKFAITVFVGIALAAIIRKLFIASLGTDSEKKALDLLSYSAVILSLGIVFWLISKRESNQ
ncbi:protoglobin domain-containing protein [Sulfurihydrogenibium sp.]|uniref:protoglobin domain-containing protein n=1 Tax=Sulfurihydrogenibium sp. TaxID=2053621 RepID=UPI00262926C4|nr:protoglobin domain-containing protein [Sulfurihydrogenibium sp.]